ncbi:MAG: hypothetical protein PHP22_05305 [Oscillospiraceae bacterium]|nr:hypothetical protein [Oscillospiraceae bacterium]
MKKRKPDPKFERSGADGEVRPVGRPGNVSLPEFSEMIDEAPDKEEPSKTDNIGTALESVEPDQVEEVTDHDETDNADKALKDTDTDNIDEILEDTEPDPSEPDPSEPDPDVISEEELISPESAKSDMSDSRTETDDEELAISAITEGISDESSSIPSPSLSFASEDPVLFRDSDDLIFPETDDDDPDLQGLSAVRISKDATIFEPRVRKLSWLKPRHIILPLIAIAVVLFSVFVILVRDKNVRSASPLIIRGIAVSNAEFSFIYNYVLLENGVDVLSESSRNMLNNPMENGTGTYRDFFLDMTAKEMQTVAILFDDAVTHGYSVDQSQIDRAQLYLDRLNQRAAAMSVDPDTFITAIFGKNVSAELILEVLSRKYFTEDYAYGPKMEELRATEDQAEEAYLSSPNQYDQVSYRLLRIVFDQKDPSFIATAHLHAREIIEKIEHDQSKFEPVAAEYFSGEEKDRILQPDSTLVSGMRYNELDDMEWRVWLFDPIRKPGDCIVFEDKDGFPILLCFSARDRLLEPLRNVRIFYLNREDPENDVPGIPEADIAVQSRIILESITDEASMHALETIYAEKIAQGWMATSQSSDVYPGKLDREFDKWIFHPDRKPGDKTSVTTDVGIAILYYIGSSKDPEWYDRVNSFIRIDNFQEFIMAKQEEYPFRFNEEGLKDI